MITNDAKVFLDKFRSLKVKYPPCMKQAMLVSAEGFRISSESSQDNFYMDVSLDLDLSRAKKQHQDVVAKIESLGVPVVCFPGIAGQDDGIYPNNSFATANHKLIVGNMFHDVRKLETTRQDIRKFFTDQLKYDIIDLSQIPVIAELTGVLAIDRGRNVSFCGFSKRVDEEGLKAMHAAFAFDLSYSFDLIAAEYHTNLVLAILASRACVVCPDSIVEQEAVSTIAAAYEKNVVSISSEEKNHFVGNCIAITTTDILFSQTSLDHIASTTKAKLEALGFNLHGVTIDELEKGGGSLRCLIAEIF